MEGVGARLGRSSSRYGTTTVFTGPVRKWTKHWVPITPSSSNNNNNNNNQNNNTQNNNSNNIINNNNNNNNSSNGSGSGSNPHLLLFKWTPLNKNKSKSDKRKSINSVNHSDIHNNIKVDDDVVDDDGDDDADDDVDFKQPPKRKFKFIPVAVLEEQKRENEENTDDEAKPVDAGVDNKKQASKGGDNDEKPDINDVPMEENQDSEENQTAPARQDLNELDLSLGLTSQDDEQDSDSKMTHLDEDDRSGSRRAGISGL